jgi:two-component system OmpR family sensor kinase
MPESPGAMGRLSELMRRVNASSDTDSILEEIVNGVVEVLGYGVAAIARLEGDSLVMTHVAGPPHVVAQLRGRRTPAERILDEFLQADRWGILRYVPAGRMAPERLESAWIPDLAPSDDEDAWHPEDALYAPLYSATGELLGNMSVDLPPGNRVPGEAERQLLEMFVVQAGLALSHARERERLTERLRLFGMLKEISAAGSSGGLTQILGTAIIAIGESLGTVQAWVRCFPDEARGVEHGAGYPRPLEPNEDIHSLRQDLVAAGVITEPVELAVDAPSSLFLKASRHHLQSILRWMGADHVVVCPVTSRGELMGYAVLCFRGKRLTQGERDAISAVGRELGRIVQQARLLETEQRLVQELGELARYRSELIATMSHELKTPLTAILGHAELLDERHPDDPSVAAIARSADRLNRLVSDILEYSRLQAARGHARQRVDLVALCAASVSLLSLRAAKGHVDLIADLPNAAMVVMGDPEELARVIDNLVDNAVKYTQGGGEVRVSITCDDAEVVVTVKDTGLGVAPADLPQLFSAFHRSTDPSILSIPGTGLGLPIAQRIAESHGGQIEVESTQGEGSRFRLRLPLALPQAPSR